MNWQYRLVKGIASLMQLALYPIKYHGLDIVNSIEGKIIIISNHRSYYDAIAIGKAVKRPIHFIGKKEIIKNSKILSNITKKLYMIPIERKTADLNAMKEAINVLRNDEILGIFPEGTRYKGGDMQDPEGGIGILVNMGRANILPVYIDKKIRPFRKTNIYFYKPIDFDFSNVKNITQANEFVMEKITSFYKNISQNKTLL